MDFKTKDGHVYPLTPRHPALSSAILNNKSESNISKQSRLDNIHNFLKDRKRKHDADIKHKEINEQSNVDNNPDSEKSESVQQRKDLENKIKRDQNPSPITFGHGITDVSPYQEENESTPKIITTKQGDELLADLLNEHDIRVLESSGAL